MSAGKDHQAEDSFDRREFLALMGASLALAGASGCSVKPAPQTEIVPYVHQPEEVVLGRPLFFATTMTIGDSAVGLLVESHEGRPTKIEGNPLHPASRGATDLFNQASVLTLYDPDRSKTPICLGQTRTWSEAAEALREQMEKQKQKRGAGLRLLTETVISPTLAQQLEDLLKEFPEAKWHLYEPVNRDTAYRGAQMAFGRHVRPVYDLAKANVVFSLDADFLACGPGNLQYVADFMARRRIRTTENDAAKAQMNRLYAVETTLTNTGFKADHRLAMLPREIETLARAAAGKLGVSSGAAGGNIAAAREKWIAVLTKDLESNRGRSLVIAGDRQPPVVHMLTHAMNERLGNIGQTVRYIEPIEARPGDRMQSLRELVNDMGQGRVDCLVILDGNPVYTAPADIPFAASVEKVPFRAHLGLYLDETSLHCQWHLPLAHYLEAWGDARAYDGTASIAQPLVEPLYQGRSAHEVTAMLASATPSRGYEIVRDYWRKHWEGRKQPGDFETFWETALHDGVIPDTAFPAKTVQLADDWQKHLEGDQRPAGKTEAPGEANEGLEVVFEPDATIYDGRFANNAWLQELPKPVTRVAWDNAVLMSPATARRFALEVGDYAHGGEHGGYYMPVVLLEIGKRSVQAPVWIMPGHADGAVTVSLGYGRTQAGAVGGAPDRVRGFDAYALRTSERPWFASAARIIKTGLQYLVACTQGHHTMANREVVRAGTLAEYKDPRFAFAREKEHLKEEKPEARRSLTLYEPFDYSPPLHKWGMVIDLTACVGCKACVVACQAENNIPVVGKDQVSRGRAMHWLRIDRYLHGSEDDPAEFYFQPVPCMHCENAPCEYVCPVEATVHSAEGLNDMLYQRCVGTRFCSNNCPYKVRRFNFLTYADFETRSLRLQYNPDVTVRSRGVMEKCSYCVQRIRVAEHDAQAEDRPIADGEVLTACQAACPAGAIVFGDINDSKSKVKQWKDSPLHYALLAGQNTEPRTTYLAALRNPHPELEAI